MKQKTGKIVKINANRLLSGAVQEHEIGCQCGAHAMNVQGTKTGRVSSASLQQSNTPKGK